MSDLDLQRRISEAEETAKKEKRGLWVDKDPIAPWEYRANAERREDDLAARQATAATAIKQFGGTVIGIDKGEEVDSIQLTGTKVADDDLEHGAAFPGLTTLYLAETRVEGTGFVHLEKLKGLEALFLAKTSTTNEGLEHLKSLKKIQALDLGRTRITDDGLAYLKGMTQMESLFLNDTFHYRFRPGAPQRTEKVKNAFGRKYQCHRRWRDNPETRQSETRNSSITVAVMGR